MTDFASIDIMQLQRALDRLPDLHAAIFLASRCDQLTFAEIAERTGLTRDHVRHIVADALSRLYQDLDEQQCGVTIGPIRGGSATASLLWVWPTVFGGTDGNAATRPVRLHRAGWAVWPARSRMTPMRTDPDHLPEPQQRELDRIQRILMDEFAEAIARATQPSRRNGKIYKIILFGSYARDDWVDEPANGYQSDFDLLVVVSHADLTDIADYWYVAEDKIQRDPSIARPVNIIVHSLDEVNQALKRGEYFWTDIARDGIALYELPCHPLATPMALTPADAHRMASEYFEHWLPSVDAFVRGARYAITDGDNSKAAFDFHQATERLYICFLLVQTLYFPRSHNIKFLRSLAEDKEPRLVAAWPRATKLDRSRFERLKRAYVEARYSASYAIGADDLEALAASVADLRHIVDAVCRERLDVLAVEGGR